MKREKFRYANRELSWLAFNHRVLQESTDPSVPLYDRIKFLAIFSSNLDEFFRVRVASLKSLISLKEKAKKKLHLDPEELLLAINKTVHRHQEEFGSIFRKQILRDLGEWNISIVSENDLTDDEGTFVKRYFHKHIEQLLTPTFISDRKEPPFLQNRSLYLAIRLLPKTTDTETASKPDFRYAIIEIPSPPHSRFISLPTSDGKYRIIFLDDIIRLALPTIFPAHDVVDAYSIKLTRDADLNIGDEFEGDLLEKIRSAVKKRSSGIASRFLYDGATPKDLLKVLRDTYALQKDDLVQGARYHNFSDFFNFPQPPQLQSLSYDPLPPLPSPIFDSAATIFDAIRKQDVMLHYPYHSFHYIVRLLQESAQDSNVESISITLYRVAQKSEIVRALIDAALQGKRVTVFVEVKARFDEESNLYWAEELEKAGVKVFYSLPGLKVHAKLCLIARREADVLQHYLYTSTGNFNEKTARIYSDIALFTSHEKLAKDAERVFDYLTGKSKSIECKHLAVAPFTLREKFTELLEREMKHARLGRDTAMVTLKMNSLEDREIIAQLYEASKAGVKIRIIVRGICCLVPGIEGMSENIRVISIVDRFLEHARVYIFHNGGDEEMFAASADMMTRNLSRRIEVMFPIYDPAIKSTLRKIIDLQLNDMVKARVIDEYQTNRYRHSRNAKDGCASQLATYDFLKSAP